MITPVPIITNKNIQSTYVKLNDDDTVITNFKTSKPVKLSPSLSNSNTAPGNLSL